MQSFCSEVRIDLAAQLAMREFRFYRGCGGSNGISATYKNHELPDLWFLHTGLFGPQRDRSSVSCHLGIIRIWCCFHLDYIIEVAFKVMQISTICCARLNKPVDSSAVHSAAQSQYPATNYSILKRLIVVCLWIIIIASLQD